MLLWTWLTTKSRRLGSGNHARLTLPRSGKHVEPKLFGSYEHVKHKLFDGINMSDPSYLMVWLPDPSALGNLYTYKYPITPDPHDIYNKTIRKQQKHLCMQPCFCWNLRVISYLNCFNKRKRQKKCLNACIFSPLQRHSCIFTVYFFFKTKKVFNPKVLKPKTRGSDNQARPKRLGLGFGFCLWSILKSLFIIFHLSFMDFIFTFLFSNTINTLMESQSIDQLRITFVAVLKLYLIALSERLPSQSGMPGSLGYCARLMRLGLATMPDPSN